MEEREAREPVDVPAVPGVPAAVPVPLPVRTARRQRPFQIQDLARWIYTHNPFYAISAALVFWGLRSSFDTHGSTFRTFALMGGLAAYTVLLALSAYGVIRFGKVWQDGRILLVLLVVMFLATSISFDDTLALSRRNGTVCYVAGLALALLLSELLLRAIHLRLPALYRLPYYLVLALFFLYPVALCWMPSDPTGPVVPWALMGFSPAAGLVYLTLLPAVRRGPQYVLDNGSPWIWPWYPWTLFFMTGLAVCGRAYYLCVSMHQAGGTATIFGPYFLVPFLLALCVLLLEVGLVSRSAGTLLAAMAAPVGLLLLAMVPPGSRLGMRFLDETFTGALGGSPLAITCLAVAGFYTYAILRRVPYAADAVCGAMLFLSAAGPRTLAVAKAIDLQAMPVLLVGVLQGGMALRTRSAPRCLLAAGCVIAAATLQFRETDFMIYRGFVPAHLALAAVLLFGALFRGPLARLLQQAGALLLPAAAIVALAGGAERLGEVPPVWLVLYPALAILTAAVYGLLVGNRLYYGSAAAGIACWLAILGNHGYRQLRQLMAGLDYILGGLASLVVGMAITLTKTSLIRCWWTERRKKRAAK